MAKRDVIMIIGAIVAAIVLSVVLFWGRSLETGSWGLSFPTEGEAPTASANSAQLKKYNAAYMGDGSEKVIYLTFDAGYENGCTAKILDVLKEHQVPAAFFMQTIR